MTAQLPARLKALLDERAGTRPVADLAAGGERLSARYRAEVLDGRVHLASEGDVEAYLATRMPATFGAIRQALSELADAVPDFRPQSLFDVGTGPGTAIFAAADAFASLRVARAIETSRPAATMARALLEDACDLDVAVKEGDAFEQLAAAEPADLVTLGYVLDELAAPRREALVEALWQKTSGVLVIVEPGTPAGWKRILAVRDRLLRLGGHVVAPCSHAADCPLAEPDWCHFAARIARSRVHRRAKGASAPFEDEKFSYVAVSRRPVVRKIPVARILAPPRAGSGKVTLKLCRSDGSCQTRLVTRREGEIFRDARRLDWGDALEVE